MAPAEAEVAPPEVPATEAVPPAAPEAPSAPDLTDQDAALAWLESLAAQHGAKEEELITPPAERLETPPEWVREAVEPEEALPPAQPPAVAPTEEEAEIPEWLREMTPTEAEAAPPEEPVVEEPVAEAEEIPEWLREMAPAEAEVAPPEVPAVEAVPPAAPETPSAPDLTDQDAALAWLEGLAAQHGAKEEELITPPAERLETPPEWVREAVEPEEALPPAQPPAAAPTEEEAKIPEWLREMTPAEAEVTPPEVPVVEEPVEAVEEEIPEWLREMAPTEAEVAPPEVPVVEEPVEAVEEAVPELLHEIVPTEAEVAPAEVPVVEEPAEAVEEEIPEWLREMAPTEAEVAPAEVPVVEEPAEAVEEEIPEWLRVIAPTEIEKPAPAEVVEEIPSALVNVNTASLSELEKLPGIGFVLAQSIMAYRDTHGPFTSIDDLVNISGIGPVLVDEIRNQTTVGVPVEAITEAPTFPPVEGDAAILSEARKAFDEGNVEAALASYTHLVRKDFQLDQIISDLQERTYRFPMDINIWQTLGDAYVRTDKLQEALEAYTKAEELLR
jgi:competence ComEA-like helix-hairpin-helix protein